MGEPCSCEEALALRAENEGLAVEVKQYRLGNEKLRELARNLWGLVEHTLYEGNPLRIKARDLGVTDD